MTDHKQTYRLEMSSPSALRPPQPGSRRPAAAAALEVRQVELACPELNWMLHQAVGVDHRWGGRESWDRQTWLEYVARETVQTWVGYLRGTPAGYYELERMPDSSVEVMCFGLLPAFVGTGLGGELLTHCVRRAWDMGANRVWLTTCNHDHPHALANYQARGFVVVEQTTGPPNRPRASALFAPVRFID